MTEPTTEELILALDRYIEGRGRYGLTTDRAAAGKVYDRLRSQEQRIAELEAACRAVAGVFQDSEDPPLYARKCLAAIAKANGVQP